MKPTMLTMLASALVLGMISVSASAQDKSTARAMPRITPFSHQPAMLGPPCSHSDAGRFVCRVLRRRQGRGSLHFFATGLTALLFLLPNHVFVISPVNQRIHFSVITVSKENAAFNFLAKEYIGGFWYQELPRTIAALAI
jgi:hypothetical protein